MSGENGVAGGARLVRSTCINTGLDGPAGALQTAGAASGATSDARDRATTHERHQ